MSTHNAIRTIAEQYLGKVTTSGPNNIMAVCPFHSRADGTPERSPSFAMSLNTGLYFCHSCQAKGGLRIFFKNMGVAPALVEQLHRYTLEALDANVEPPPDPLRPNIISQAPIDEQLLGLLNYCPTSLVQDGYAEETLRTFEVGYDRWHNRVTYPIRDLKGQLVAVSGRALDPDNHPRYKIYKKEYEVWELPIRDEWDKRSVLYNAHAVYPLVYFESRPPPVVVVEGFKACMWVWQAGIRNVVALLGTYCSWEHKWILERLGAPVYLFLDNNEPGWKGAYKTAGLLSESLQVSIIPYPDRLAEDEKAQPDACTQQEVVEQYRQAIGWYEFLNRTRL